MEQRSGCAVGLRAQQVGAGQGVLWERKEAGGSFDCAGVAEVGLLSKYHASQHGSEHTAGFV